MTIDEALYELESPDDLTFNRHTEKFDRALMLGIEALKRWQEYRARGMGWWMSLLPGETEE